MKRTLIGGGAVLLLALIIWFVARSDSGTITTPQSEAELQALASKSLETLNTLTYDEPESDWITYASESLNFSMQHPASWIPENCGPACVAWATTEDTEDLIVGVNITEDTLDSLLEQAAPFAIASSTLSFNNITWERVTLQHPVLGGTITSHFAAHNGKVYEFGTTSDDTELLETYSRMLRSFRFTN